MKSNCLTISILSLIVFIVILYLVNKNNGIFSFQSIENYQEPIQTIILNARPNINDKPSLINISQLMCDNITDNSLCLNKYTLNHSNINP